MKGSANWFTNPKRVQEVLENEKYIQLLAFLQTHYRAILGYIFIAWVVLLTCLFTLIFTCVVAVNLAMTIPY